MDNHRHLVIDRKDRVLGRTRYLGAELGIVATDPIPVETANEDFALDPAGETSADKIGVEWHVRPLPSADFQRFRAHHRLKFVPAWGTSEAEAKRRRPDLVWISIDPALFPQTVASTKLVSPRKRATKELSGLS